MSFYLRFLFRFSLVILCAYGIICLFIFFSQESLIFHPTAVALKTEYDFGIPHVEKNISVGKKAMINGILCMVPNPRGLIFFLHGNAGNVSDTRGAAEFYTRLGYDFFSFDYRGFGKSTGKISGEKQFYNDIQTVYNALKKAYAEKDIIIAGYSIGTAPAAMLAARNQRRKLILMAPYYSMKELAKYHYPYVPAFLLKYKFETFSFLQRIQLPVLIGHGKNDGTILFDQSLKLAKLLKNGKFIGLEGEGHNGIQSNETFQEELREFLN